MLFRKQKSRKVLLGSEIGCAAAVQISMLAYKERPLNRTGNYGIISPRLGLLNSGTMKREDVTFCMGVGLVSAAWCACYSCIVP